MPRRAKLAPVRPGYWVDAEIRDAWDAAEAKRIAKREAAKQRKSELGVGSAVEWPSRYSAPLGVIVEMLEHERCMVTFEDQRTIPVRVSFLVAMPAMSGAAA
jgi:hypothetical protein